MTSPNEQFIDQLSIRDLAKKYGTPLFVHQRSTFVKAYQTLSKALGKQRHTICYAVKANSTLGILQEFDHLGAGFDIVSQGELERLLHCGVNPHKIHFSGVGKDAKALKRALTAGIGCFNIESKHELELLQQIAHKCDVKAPIAFRVNPDIHAQTHPYIATGSHTHKFGIPYNEALDYYLWANTLPNILIKGVHCHIGSNIMQLEPFIEAANAMYELYHQCQSKHINLTHINCGGGIGISYQATTQTPSLTDWGQALAKVFQSLDIELICEPGRALIGASGSLITEVIDIKHQPDHYFAITDAAMNDLIRPALYQAHHEVVPVVERTGKHHIYDIVGQICETGDFLAQDRSLVIEIGDLLMIKDVGAYGFSMSSQYNSRRRAAMILVDGDQATVLRARERYSDLWTHEKTLER